MGSALCRPAGDDSICCLQSTVHPCHFPLWAVKVSDFLEMHGPPEPHSTLKEKGLLHQWFEDMFVIFISHQWLSSAHPDPQGEQVRVLQRALRSMIDGSLHVAEDLVSMSADMNLSSNMRQHIASGFIFFDWFAIPQITARQSGVNEEAIKSDAALAVQSIPAYVELSNLFLAVVPELMHKDTAALVNYGTWLSRGWCRAELWCRLLSNKADTSVIVVHSPAEAEFMFPLDWQHSTIVDGDFTVEADRATVVQLGETAVESKVGYLQFHGPLSHYRFYSALRPKLLCQKQVSRDVDEFLEYFQFDTLQEAAQDTSSMNAAMCAVLSGDAPILRRLAENRANMNFALHGLSDLGFYDTQTLLMAAVKSRQDESLLRTLLSLRADVNGRARTTLPALYMCRSSEHVKLLVEHRAELPNYVLNGAVSFAGPDTVMTLLKLRCDPNSHDGTWYGPLHAVALLSRSNRHAVANAKLLLDHRADVNTRCTQDGWFYWECQWAQMRAAIYGFENCNMMTKERASVIGVSPLGYAALVGHTQLIQLYLDHGAECYPNDRGDWPDDLARKNHHYHLIPMLATFPT